MPPSTSSIAVESAEDARFFVKLIRSKPEESTLRTAVAQCLTSYNWGWMIDAGYFDFLMNRVQ